LSRAKNTKYVFSNIASAIGVIYRGGFTELRVNGVLKPPFSKAPFHGLQKMPRDVKLDSQVHIHTGWSEQVSPLTNFIKIVLKPANKARFWVQFECRPNWSTKIL